MRVERSVRSAQSRNYFAGRQDSPVCINEGRSKGRRSRISMIRKDLVLTHKYLEGDAVTIRCAHGDITLHPLADVDLEVDGLPIKGRKKLLCSRSCQWASVTGD